MKPQLTISMVAVTLAGSLAFAQNRESKTKQVFDHKISLQQNGQYVLVNGQCAVCIEGDKDCSTIATPTRCKCYNPPGNLYNANCQLLYLIED